MSDYPKALYKQELGNLKYHGATDEADESQARNNGYKAPEELWPDPEKLKKRKSA